jgi:hypothetical protein
MLLSIATVALALQFGVPARAPNEDQPSVQEIQYRVPIHPPPCGDGWDVSARNGMCYPNGYLPPQEQAARQYYRGPDYGGGRYPIPCGNGADIDVRDGLCYPTGTVPPRFQQGRQYPPRYDDGYYQPRRRYY